MSAEEPVHFNGQDHAAILAELEESGEKFVDEHEEAHISLPKIFESQVVEWIRCSKMGCCTDDNGEVATIRKEYIDENGELKNVNFENEYRSEENGNTLMDACLGQMFWFIDSDCLKPFVDANSDENIKKGIWKVPLCINGTWISVVMSDKVPCIGYFPIYNKQKSGALWQVMMEKALAKYHGGYDKIHEFSLDNKPTSLTPCQVMMELTGLPTVEYELAQWEYYTTNIWNFEDKIIRDEWKCRKILCTWNEKRAPSKFPKKCVHGSDNLRELEIDGFPVGCHILTKVISYEKEDGSWGLLCLIKAPNGYGNEFREKGWNKERYPTVEEQGWEQLTPLFNDYDERYFMDWDNVLKYFETMHCTFNYFENTTTHHRAEGKMFFKVNVP